MNKVYLIGNLTRDPEMRATSSGVSVCNFSIAVNRRFRNQNGQQETDFFNIVAWRQLGENCAKYLAKGRKVCVVGPVTCRTYVGNDGQTRASLEVTANEVEFLSSRNDQGDMGSYSAPAAAPVARPAAAPANYGSAPQGGGFVQVDEEELPF